MYVRGEWKKRGYGSRNGAKMSERGGEHAARELDTRRHFNTPPRAKRGACTGIAWAARDSAGTGVWGLLGGRGPEGGFSGSSGLHALGGLAGLGIRGRQIPGVGTATGDSG
jgi:hypothetical protein